MLLATTVAAAAEMKIIRVFSGWRDAASFKRISEYFDGKENTGGQLVLRTHADQRDGYYFLVRVAHAGAPLDARIKLHVVRPTAATPAAYSFSTSLPGGESVLHLGLTGPDWPDKKANPVAWKLELCSADGSVLATEKSYLWEKPANN
jgi:hypothetical protein